jgi:hypothetical protein
MQLVFSKRAGAQAITAGNDLDARFPNGRCPPNCNCDDLYWYDVIDSIEGYVEDYEFVIREWLPGQPIPNSRPKKDTLIAAATRTYWQSKQDSIGGLRPDGPSLILDWPLPPCFHRMYKNIDSIFND